MEVKALPALAVVLLLVGMVVGIGVLTFDKFGDAAKDRTALSETLEIISDTGEAAQDEIYSIESLYNTTVTFTASTNYNFTKDTVVKTIVTSGIADGNYTLNYTYYKDVTATTTLTDASTAVGGISTNWMGLIVTIAVLAIILWMVVQSFGKGAR